MRPRVAIPALIALLAVVSGASSRAETVQSENLRVTFGADFSPRSLPRLRPAPVTVEIHGTGKILAFNGRGAGRKMLLLHLFAGVPVRFTMVVPLKIEHPREGEFG